MTGIRAQLFQLRLEHLVEGVVGQAGRWVVGQLIHTVSRRELQAHTPGMLFMLLMLNNFLLTLLMSIAVS